MPYMTDGKRDYSKQAKYDSKPSVKKNRAKRNTARRRYEKEHGELPSTTDVHHKRPLSKGGSNNRSNTTATSRSKNRSFKRKKNGAMK